jgi:hypothetical protein
MDKETTNYLEKPKRTRDSKSGSSSGFSENPKSSKEERLISIAEELKNKWIEANGPMEVELSEEEIKRRYIAKQVDRKNYVEPPVVFTREAAAFLESVPSRAERIYAEKYEDEIEEEIGVPVYIERAPKEVWGDLNQDLNLRSWNNSVKKATSSNSKEVLETDSEKTGEVSRENGEKLLAGIVEEMVSSWIKENNNGQPLVKPLKENEINRMKDYALSKGEKWDGRITFMQPKAEEFWYGAKNHPGFSLPNRAKNILVERYPEYADLKNELEVTDPQEYLVEVGEPVVENVEPVAKPVTEPSGVPLDFTMEPVETVQDKNKPDEPIVESEPVVGSVEPVAKPLGIPLDFTMHMDPVEIVQEIDKPDEPAVVEGEPKPEASFENPDRVEYLRLKREFIETRRNFLSVLGNDYEGNYKSILSKEFITQSYRKFGGGREKLSEGVVQKAYDQYILANKNFLKYTNNSDTFREITDRLSRRHKKLHPGADDYSVKPAQAERHILKLAKERLKLQTKVLMPEIVTKNYKKVLELIKKHPKTALAVGVAALGVGGFVAGAAATTSYASRAVVGISAKYFVSKAGEEGILDKKKASIENLRRDITDTINRDDFDLEEMEREYFSSENSLQMTTTGVKTASWIAGGAFAAAYSPDVSGVALNINDANPNIPSAIPDQPIEAVPEAIDPRVDDFLSKYLDSTDKVTSPESYLRPEADIELPEESTAETAEVNNIKVTEESAFGNEVLNNPSSNADTVLDKNLSNHLDNLKYKTESPEGFQFSKDIQVDSVDANAESIPASVDKNGEIHEVKRTENLSTILFDSLKRRLEAGDIKLPAGVDKNSLAHHMYQSFPEMTSAKDISSTLNHDQWVELGIKSGNPHDIRPGEKINIEALIEKMRGLAPEIKVPVIEQPVSLGGSSIDLNYTNVDASAGDLSLDLDLDKTAMNSMVETGTPGSLEDVVLGNMDSKVPPFDSTPIATFEPIVGQEAVTASAGLDEVPDIETKPNNIDQDFTNPDNPVNNRYEISDSLKEATLAFNSEEIDAGKMISPEGNPNYLFEHLAKIFEKELGPDGKITLPLKLSSSDPGPGWSNFTKDVPGLLKHQLPELELVKGLSFDQPALTINDWKDLGVSSGNPLDIKETDTIKIGVLYEYILSSDIDQLREALKK